MRSLDNPAVGVGDWPDIKPVLDFISARPALALAYGLSGGFFFWNMNR